MTASIRAIDSESVHRIHSGQVVLELQGAIKELLENSLDAGATSIEVRIKDNGTESVEVVDNGSGIAQEDWEYIGLKHHTSKLPSLSHLPQVTTFGFRGEALSALCALCESVTITTATEGMAPLGAVIRLGRDGRVLDSSGRVARQRGTTVSLVGLFKPLPVRRKEFERNAKREITKALAMLTGYALVPASAGTSVSVSASASVGGSGGTDASPGVRIKVESISGGKGGKRNTLLANDGRGSLRASVTSVWGVKALDGVLDINQELEFDVDPRARRDDLATTQTVRVVGLISSAAWGQGRSSADRQFFYVNGRPCDLKSVQKVVNEVYKSFNTHQVPLAILDFQIPRDSVDINVSPDKRTIMIHSESNLLSSLRTMLEEFFAPSRSSYAVQGATQTVSVIKGLTQSTLRGVGKVAAVSNEIEEEVEDENGVQDENEVGVENEVEDDDEDQGEDEVDEGERGVEKGGEDLGEEQEEAMEEQEEGVMAGPSRSSSRRSERNRVALEVNDEPMVLEEDEGEGEEEQSHSRSQSQSQPSQQSLRRSAAARHRRQTPPSSPRSAPAISVPSRRVQQTLSTTTASWSPERKSAAAATRGGARSGSSKATAKDTRRSFRDRLAGYASQGQVTRVRSESGSDNEDEDEDGGSDDGDGMGYTEEKGLGSQERRESEEIDELESEAVSEDPGGGLEEQREGGVELAPMEIDADEVVVEVDADEVVMEEADRVDPTTSSPFEPARHLAGPISKGGLEAEAVRPGSSASPLGLHATSSSQRLAGGSSDSRRLSRKRSPTPADEEDETLPEAAPNAPTPPRAGPSRTSSSYRDENTSTAPQGSMVLAFDLERLTLRFAKRRRHSPTSLRQPRDAFSAIRDGGVVSAAGVSNRDGALAEEALRRVISKGDFARMEVLGQFNKGFIIARLRSGDDQDDGAGGAGGAGGTDDLFIVDQHASDEKFNFETLQRTTVIKAQKLIKPRALQLTAGDEIVATENLDVLQANGFEVGVDEDKPPGRGERISLVAMPVSKDTTFDYKDLEQLLHLLSDGARPAGQMVRCSKARAMFAMRACRKSVMIGKSLTKGQMVQLLRNMGTIDQPWSRASASARSSARRPADSAELSTWKTDDAAPDQDRVGPPVRDRAGQEKDRLGEMESGARGSRGVNRCRTASRAWGVDLESLGRPTDGGAPQSCGMHHILMRELYSPWMHLGCHGWLVMPVIRATISEALATVVTL
ncbi:hypothetical protein EHS25_008318 [Saitozyma podzolica]|uniref:DNA mismatch repair protein n=1 Tax=Saitozyma podzolica TaxID=1890683 RepID=A0A427YP35_9TREE|nr:hypothetical protein EHS25_008318 [Saitozyma podzolica]